MALPDLARLSSWRQAREQAETNGWKLAATGDWSWLYRSPDGDRAWRITPFDPAFRTFVEVCGDTPNPHLPRVEAVVDHPDGGYSVFMEWLDPVSEDEASRWFETFRRADQGEVAEARRLLMAAAEQSELPLFVGLDANPTNLLHRSSEGVHVFTDAFWINGPQLYELVTTDPEQALTHYSADELEHWAHLPCMDAAGTQAILSAINR